MNLEQEAKMALNDQTERQWKDHIAYLWLPANQWSNLAEISPRQTFWPILKKIWPKISPLEYKQDFSNIW